MKKITTLIALAVFGLVKAQTNTFPTPTGNVGVNTTATPTEELEVNGTTKTNQLIIGNKTNVPGFINVWREGSISMNEFINISGNPVDERLWAVSVFGKDFRILTESDDFASAEVGFAIKRGAGIAVDRVVFPKGKIGIGTENPSAKFHIVDANPTINIENAGVWTAGSGATINFNHNQSGLNAPIAQIKSSLVGGGTATRRGDLTFFTTLDAVSEERMVIKYNGEVGIGTTNPAGWKLAVNGKIRAKEIKVETGWADFVFEDDYQLPTLEEVAQHIEEKGHLKDIPSAKEVEENGILLGEMDSKLLQKIEELTLYMIEMNREIKELKEENKKLKAQLKK